MEFGAAINMQSPILAQLFTHTMEEVLERTWCITRESTVPEGLRTYRNPEPHCRITLMESNVLKAQGKCCSLSALNSFLESLTKPIPGHRFCQVFLDKYVHTALAYPILDDWRAYLENTRLMTRLFNKYGLNDLIVIWLGDIYEYPGGLHVGLIIGATHPTETERDPEAACYRYGVYIWREPTKDKVDWHERELLIK
ncbi:hypothetical protein EJ04DRAFT_582392 [Polyplosphaeria fusca]|uniref:Uncharacterized protein n=1 Tax=Polyplosphaeria fusca TaxID=682080 RepID=A0A9P4QGL8_9PLEO|nr:hypothetical protein EJ04DRAFT_582392 [Polyplosphaeria fusca]